MSMIFKTIINFFSSYIKTNSGRSINDYCTLPIIDTSHDRYSEKGYVERKLLSMKYDYELCENIFRDSSMPIIADNEHVNRRIETWIMKNPDGTIGRIVGELFYYDIKKRHRVYIYNEISVLNNILLNKGLEKYKIEKNKINFGETKRNINNTLPLTLIIYNGQKNEFSLIFSDELQGTSECTQSGNIIYSEDGIKKSATITKKINGINAYYKFKKYKTGFDLYDIKFNGEIIYKRNSK